MEEKSIKRKGPKLIVFIIISFLIIMLLGMQVFATFNGYGNVFFLIKNLISPEPTIVTNKEEILLDKDITISYQFVEVTKDIDVQVNNLELKENESTLCLTVRAKNNELLPLKYSLKGEGLEETELEGSNTTTIGEFKERLTLSHKFYGDELMTLYIKDRNGNLLKEFEINLHEKQIAVVGQKSFEKISEVELKKYLNIFSDLNNTDESKNNVLLEMSDKINSEIVESKEKLTKDQYDQIISEFYEDEIQYDSDGILVVDGKKWKYEPQIGTYVRMLVENKKELCLNIEDITYENGIYDVKYIYVITSNTGDNIEELQEYEGNIKLAINNEYTYSKYRVKSISYEIIENEEENPNVVVSNNVINNTVVTNNISNNTVVTNNISNNTVNTTNNVIRNTVTITNNVNNNVVNNDHIHAWSVVKRSGNENFHTTLDGTHKVVCTICGATKTEPHNFGTWYTINDATAWTLWCTDCQRYIYTNDYTFVQNSGYSYEDRNQYLSAIHAQELLKKFYKIRVGIDQGLNTDLCEALGFSTSDVKLNNPKVETLRTGELMIEYVETNISYNEFKSRMLEFMTERLFDEEFSGRTKNVEGKLYIIKHEQLNDGDIKQYYNPGLTKKISEGRYHTIVTMIGQYSGTFDFDFYTDETNGQVRLDRIEDSVG